MTAQEANTAANNKITTTYTYANLQALITQEANAGNFSITTNTEGYHREYDQFFPNLISDGYIVKTDYVGFTVILWDNESLSNQSTSTSTTETTTTI